MKSGYADLHIHTKASDSTFSVEQVLELAKASGLRAIGITDHDTVDGLARAVEIAPSYGVEIIPGVELSAEENNCEIHILGYFMDWKNPAFKSKLDELRSSRLERAKSIIEKLAGLNIDLKLEKVLALTESYTAVGRLHIARAMKLAGFVSEIPEAFRKYLGQNGPAYVKKQFLSPLEAANLIKNAGGIPVMAHPGVLNNYELIEKVLQSGMQGVEVYHTEHSSGTVEKLKELAVKYNLLITGGSDDHGAGKSKIYLGSILIPYEYVEKMKLSLEKDGK
ncbi:MAG: PHP domain-containing protein [Candidatus Firestonebacteria bacterium]